MPQQKSTAQTYSNNSAIDNTDTAPSWDTSPNSLPAYVLELQRWLPKQDARYRGLIEYGITVDKTRTVFVSENHSDRYRHNKLVKGTVKKPCRVAPSDLHVVNEIASLDADELASQRSQAGVIGAASVATLETALLEAVLATIKDDDTVDEWREACNGEGLTLLKLLEDEKWRPERSPPSA